MHRLNFCCISPYIYVDSNRMEVTDSPKCVCVCVCMWCVCVCGVCVCVCGVCVVVCVWCVCVCVFVCVDIPLTNSSD
jgi:hypothetical protein